MEKLQAEIEELVAVQLIFLTVILVKSNFLQV